MKKSIRILAILLAMMMILLSVPVAFAEVDTSVPPPYWGDLNGDHKADFSDILQLNKIRLGKIQGTPEQLCFGDVNLNGELQGVYDEEEGLVENNIFDDILQINKFRLGKISSLPAYSLAEYTFNPPTKTIYKQGEALNKAGMSVVIKNKNNPNVKYTLTENISVSEYNKNKIGTQKLTATFRGMTFPFNVTVKNIYNLGDETYSFKNFNGKYTDQYGCVRDNQCSDPNCKEPGHCFGMSITSAGYYLGELNKSLIGSSNDKSLYSFSFTDAVKSPIHYYQDSQGENRDKSMIAGGTAYKTWKYNILTGKSTHTNDINKDWTEVVNEVKDHSYDGKGNLQIGFRKDGLNGGGHAINFLRYERFDGEDRIYAYDNNYPNGEVYFSKDGNGKVFEHGYSTFSGAIDCITLRDVKKYFVLEGSSEGSSNESTVSFIVPIENVVIDGAKAYPLDNDSDAYILLKAKNTDNHFIVRPLVDYATFSCSGRECQFGAIDDDTYADIVFPDSPFEGAVSGAFTFTIHNAPDDSSGSNTPTQPTQPSGGCKYCGGTHTGFPGVLIGFFHSILAMFGLRK